MSCTKIRFTVRHHPWPMREKKTVVSSLCYRNGPFILREERSGFTPHCSSFHIVFHYKMGKKEKGETIGFLAQDMKWSTFSASILLRKVLTGFEYFSWRFYLEKKCSLYSNILKRLIPNLSHPVAYSP